MKEEMKGLSEMTSDESKPMRPELNVRDSLRRYKSKRNTEDDCINKLKYPRVQQTFISITSSHIR